MGAPNEFSIDGTSFKTRAMSAEAQLDVLVKVSPLLAAGFAEIIPFYVQLRRDGIASVADASLGQLVGLLTPVARELSKMPKGELWSVIGGCLECCERQVGNSWSPVWNKAANRPQFQDVNDDLLFALRIAFAVFEASFARFFPASLSNFIGGLKA